MLRPPMTRPPTMSGSAAQAADLADVGTLGYRASSSARRPSQTGSPSRTASVIGSRVVRRVEVHLRLGWCGQPAVTPAHLDMSVHDALPPVLAVADGCSPRDNGLAAGTRLDLESAELELPAPVPRRGDAQTQEAA